MMKRATTILAASMILGAGAALAGEVEIVGAKAQVNAVGAYTISVTLKHGDEGWNHYANAWDVVTPDGTVLGKRKLAHPHVNEQPFTRSLSGIKVPRGIKTVTIRAYDKVHGISDQTYALVLPDRSASLTLPARKTTTTEAIVVKKKAVSKTKRKVLKKRKVVKKRVATSKRRIVKKRVSASKRRVVKKKIVRKRKVTTSKRRAVRKKTVRARTVSPRRKTRAPRRTTNSFRSTPRRTIRRGSF